jgi:hypothetical protein
LQMAIRTSSRGSGNPAGTALFAGLHAPFEEAF